ncbi:Hypothetical predicted protein, partial [Paramuricea clavata]
CKLLFTRLKAIPSNSTKIHNIRSVQTTNKHSRKSESSPLLSTLPIKHLASLYRLPAIRGDPNAPH